MNLKKYYQKDTSIKLSPSISNPIEPLYLVCENDFSQFGFGGIHHSSAGILAFVCEI